MTDEPVQNAGWTPLDLATTSSDAFYEWYDGIKEAAKAQAPLPKLDLPNGVVITIAPDLAYQMLLRNKSNRKPSLDQVRYYARMMKAGQWKVTGQPIIFDTDGYGLDLQHRCLASVLGDVAFPTYIISTVPPGENLFAFIDNSKVRSASDALYTAGMNGQAKILTGAVKVAQAYDLDAYTATSKEKVDKMSPIEVMDYVAANPLLSQAARLMAGEYASANKVIGHSDIAVFAAFKIIELDGESILDDFMDELGSAQQGSPAIEALYKVLEANRFAVKPMQKHQVLGHIIKAYKAWRNDEPVKRITLKVNENFPRFDDVGPVDDASDDDTASPAPVAHPDLVG